jgi:hypothetical protein
MVTDKTDIPVFNVREVRTTLAVRRKNGPY